MYTYIIKYYYIFKYYTNQQNEQLISRRKISFELNILLISLLQDNWLSSSAWNDIGKYIIMSIHF